MDVSFFFSSRRRHTRYWRDWSSDVCSSDLLALEKHRRFVDEIERRGDDAPALMQPFAAGVDLFRYETRGNDWYEVLVTHYRSEERRVGKECRSRWSPYH